MRFARNIALLAMAPNPPTTKCLRKRVSCALHVFRLESYVCACAKVANFDRTTAKISAVLANEHAPIVRTDQYFFKDKFFSEKGRFENRN